MVRNPDLDFESKEQTVFKRILRFIPLKISEIKYDKCSDQVTPAGSVAAYTSRFTQGFGGDPVDGSVKSNRQLSGHDSGPDAGRRGLP